MSPTKDAPPAFPRDAWRALARQGLPGLFVPRRYGGRAASLSEGLFALERFGAGCRDNGLALALVANAAGVAPAIARHGRETLKRRVLPSLCRGSLIGAQAVSEEHAGSDVYALSARFRRSGKDFLLDGTKAFVSNADGADFFLVHARAAGTRGMWGLGVFLVEKTRPGLRLGRRFGKMGLPSISLGELELRGCRVPAGNLLGAPGAGAAVFRSVMERLWLGLAAAQAGAMERQLDEAVRYARGRRQFGRSIGEFQAVSHRLADMKTRLEASRAMLRQAARIEGAGLHAAAAAAKLFVSEARWASAQDAVRLRGGRGYLSDFGAEQELRDALAGVLHSGTSDVLKNLVAEVLFANGRSRAGRTH